MKLVPLNKIFNIKYGNQFDFNKIEVGNQDDINFVSRSSQNLGVVAQVLRFNDIEPFEEGLITVTLGGTYLLSSFVQPKRFYTGQNVKVLSPKRKMSFAEKVFYCKAIEANRYKYASHGREANTTFVFIVVPEKVPVEYLKVDIFKLFKDYSKAINPKNILFDTSKWKTFKYGGNDGIFEIRNGYYNKKPDHIEDGNIPFIGSSMFNNGVTEYYSLYEIENTNKSEQSTEHDLNEKIFTGNCVTVANNGVGVGHAFYQIKDFTCSHDVNVLYLKDREWNKYIALFICTLIQMERYRWTHGRKWRPSRMPDSEMKLPVDKKGKPDFTFMENFIKSLPYSSSI